MFARTQQQFNGTLDQLRYDYCSLEVFSSRHLTAESYTVIYQLTVVFIDYFSITHSLFHTKLKTFLFCKSFPLQPFFFFFRTGYDRLYMG